MILEEFENIGSNNNDKKHQEFIVKAVAMNYYYHWYRKNWLDAK